ncbi:MAG TPA: FkbM family methyltransferase [Gemmatimonadaceae bacterium]|nr:FkbM family methyltransferase [Gemmatimonadaceae bacterium]
MNARSSRTGGIKTLVKRTIGTVLPERVVVSLAHAFLGGLKPASRQRWLRIYHGNDLTWSLATLRDLGFRPNAIVDVGAFVGEWSATAHEHFPGAAIAMLEARPTQRAVLQQVADTLPDAEVVIALLGAAPRDAVPFHITEGGGGSSVMNELSDVPRETVMLPVVTLDDAIRGLRGAARVRTPILLKLDVQGYEREVLLGGTETLAAAEVVVMELSTQRLNEGAPLAHEMIQFMSERGFQLFDITGFWREKVTDVLLQVDVVFVRGSSVMARRRKG